MTLLEEIEQRLNHVRAALSDLEDSLSKLPTEGLGLGKRPHEMSASEKCRAAQNLVDMAKAIKELEE